MINFQKYISTEVGEMPVDWERMCLEDISEFITKGSTPTTYGFKWEESGIPFLRSECVSENGFIENGISYISEEANNAMNRSKVQSDDILISITGNVGRVAIYPKKYESGNINQHIARVRIIKNDIVDRLFIYFQVNQPNYRNYYNGIVTGAAYPQLSLKQIRETPVFVPTLETQKRIASILCNYDDLIENNLKRIKLLEETAQNIYKEWFVNFRFPNYEHTAFDEVSGLPVGWEKKTIDAYAEVITGKTPSTANSNFYGGNIPFVKTPDMHDAPYVLSTSIYLSNEGAISQNNKFLPKNSVMVSCIGTAGVVALASTNCQTNQQINSVRFDEEFKAFYFYGFARGLKTLLEGLGSNGATMVNVNKSKFEKIELIVPDIETLKRHYGIVKVIFDKILILQEQNEKLKEARDILLPRLMNRTIEV